MCIYLLMIKKQQHNNYDKEWGVLGIYELGSIC